jgi:hypothetical protein
MPGIDKNHEAWTLAAKGREMFTGQQVGNAAGLRQITTWVSN